MIQIPRRQIKPPGNRNLTNDLFWKEISVLLEKSRRTQFDGDAEEQDELVCELLDEQSSSACAEYALLH